MGWITQRSPRLTNQEANDGDPVCPGCGMPRSVLREARTDPMYKRLTREDRERFDDNQAVREAAEYALRFD